MKNRSILFLLRIIFILVILAIILLISFPIWKWHDMPIKYLDAVIIDKTVPIEDYREHKGLMWVLNHNKIYDSKTKESFKYEEDYFGYYPSDGDSYEVEEYKREGTNPQLIYIADTYGVYEDDYQMDDIKGDRSTLIYGGLDSEELTEVKKSLVDGNTIIGEFNTMASPTDRKEREEIEDIFGVQWSGWIGRYYNDMTEGIEVPNWIIENYEEQHESKWEFNTSGFIFVSEYDEVIVLEKDIHIGKSNLLLEFKEPYKKEFGIKKEIPYYYWFEILEPYEESEVLAEYTLDVTDEGKRILQDKGISLTFPAVVRNNRYIYNSYYFAGDFADNNKVGGVNKVYGIEKVKKIFSLDVKGDTEAFYWKCYVPLMNTILEDILYSDKNYKQKQLEIKTVVDFKVPAMVGKDKIQILKNDQWEDFLIKGVNMGIAKPGYFPGETAITKEEYLRWFEYIGEMNANSIRIYTVHPPEFYEAFYEYNEKAEEPLYLFHGVWIEEENLLETQNAFDESNLISFQEAIKDTIDVINGNANIEKVIGHASGVYRYDISQYVIGWIIGIEWDPNMVVNTNEKNKNLEDFNGKYIYTKDASPFEIWLAENMEFTLNYEYENYKWQRPISFTNWVTTDLLTHPSEPSEEEDLVEVNPNHIYSTEKDYSGIFASYHIYPYYPDFLNYEEKYINYVDKDGEKNNYAGYINEMKNVHDMPILVTEFGVPASRGETHENVYNMNQGFNSEKQQGEIDSKLFKNIVDEEMAGGLIFSWQDEWFKRTWNTMDYDDPDRRPYWSNDQTNEQQFGLMSFDPGKEQVIGIDGIVDDWEKAVIDKAFEENLKPINNFDDGYDDGRTIKNLYATSDEKYLYLRIDYKDFGGSIDWTKMNTLILLNTKSNQGNTNIPFNTGIKIEEGCDFIIHLNGKENSRILVDSYYDSFYYNYGEKLNLIPKVENTSIKDNGVFNNIRLALNKEMYIPSQDRVIPFSSYETGKLMYGIGNPNHEDYNSLSDFYYDEDNNEIEIRIPWLLLNFKDPSTRKIMGDLWKEDLSGSEIIDGIDLAVLTFKPDENGNAIVTENITNVTDSMPKPKEGSLRKEDTYLYQWDTWDLPLYHERLKQSYYIVKDLFDSYK
ncbi:hypothetical protein [Clostridium sp. DL1XJH146]